MGLFTSSQPSPQPAKFHDPGYGLALARQRQLPASKSHTDRAYPSLRLGLAEIASSRQAFGIGWWLWKGWLRGTLASGVFQLMRGCCATRFPAIGWLAE